MIHHLDGGKIFIGSESFRGGISPGQEICNGLCSGF